MIGQVTAVIRPICRVAFAQRSENRPSEWRMTLLLDPGKEVIGNGGEVEAGLFGAIGIAYQIGRAVLLGYQFVAELDHRHCP
jgi:hypothetical protein